MKRDELSDKAKKEFERLLDECAAEVENLLENPMALDTNLKKQIEIGKKYDKLLSDILKDENNRKICTIIDDAQLTAYHSVNVILVLRNWLLGKRISEEELKGEDRASYGMEIIKKLSAVLSERYGKGFSRRTLYKCQQFYKLFPEIVPTLSAQFNTDDL